MTVKKDCRDIYSDNERLRESQHCIRINGYVMKALNGIPTFCLPSTWNESLMTLTASYQVPPTEDHSLTSSTCAGLYTLLVACRLSLHTDPSRHLSHNSCLRSVSSFSDNGLRLFPLEVDIEVPGCFDEAGQYVGDHQKSKRAWSTSVSLQRIFGVSICLS